MKILNYNIIKICYKLICFKRITVDCKRMYQTKKTYTLGKIKQLIDLNGDSTNFNLSFKVSCKDNTPFNLLVVDQTTLDNSPKLDYKESKGTISGNIVADKNIFQNYFLILKSDTPCEVDVELMKNELPRTPDIKMDTRGATPSVRDPHGHAPAMKPPLKQGMSLMKIGLIAVVVIGGLALLWYLYKRKSPSTTQKTILMDSPKPSERGDVGFSQTPVFPTRHISPTPSKRLPVHNSSSAHSSSAHAEPVYKSTKTPEFKSEYRPSYDRQPTYKPKYTLPVRTSPDVMSAASSARSDAVGGASLLDRLRKYAR